VEQSKPHVLCGDFNTTSDVLYFRYQQYGFSEVFDFDPTVLTVDNQNNPLRQRALARLFGRGKKKPNKRIDAILFRELSEQIAVTSSVCCDGISNTERYVGPLSDHAGIEATFFW
jgi:endonuclease/exonuclease/phosphatase family metal-dependent hydrolase